MPFDIQVILEHESGLPEDVTVNTFHFLGDPTVENAESASVAIHDFYNANATGLFSIASYLSADIVRTIGAHTIKAYDPFLPPKSPPFWSAPFSITDAAATSGRMPTEVALVLSFQALPSVGVPQARRRGRVYIGPLNTAAMNADTNSRPANGFINTLRAAGEGLFATDVDITWATKSTVAPGAAVYAPVENGWVDNAWDTQRRRGLAPSVRTIFTAP